MITIYNIINDNNILLMATILLMTTLLLMAINNKYSLIYLTSSSAHIK